MHKPGVDPDNVRMSDVLCDFCRAEWREELPMVEGHQGSVICGRCAAVAYTRVVLLQESTAPLGYCCTLCLENRKDRAWQSPTHPEAVACERCVRQAASALEKDPDTTWTRPGTAASDD